MFTDMFQAGAAEERSYGESDVQRSVWYSGQQISSCSGLLASPANYLQVRAAQGAGQAQTKVSMETIYIYTVYIYCFSFGQWQQVLVFIVGRMWLNACFNRHDIYWFDCAY